jgi:large subunit ribosomal protein L54
MKDQPDPIAKPDEDYPGWLWTLLDGGKTIDMAVAPRPTAAEMASPGFDFEMERKRLRAV